MARAARAAYLDDVKEIAALLEKSGLRGIVKPFKAEDTEGFLYQDDEQALVAFRGSQTLGDWVYNANLQLVAWPGPGRVHQGFFVALDAVWQGLSAQLADLPVDRKLWYAGHSLGGALAMLAADRLRLEQDRSCAGIFTFGAPKVGDAEFAQDYDHALRDKTFSLLNHGDPIPWLPLFHSEFAECGQGYYMNPDGTLSPRPNMLEATLLFLGSMIGKDPEQMLEVKPHTKEEYLRQLETRFNAAEH